MKQEVLQLMHFRKDLIPDLTFIVWLSFVYGILRVSNASNTD